MLSAKIYAHARRTPDRIALVYNGNRMPYGRFAGLIEASRRYLRSRVGESNGVAVLAIGSALDAWIQGLALRSLGLTTVVSETIERVGLATIACVVATEAEYRADLEAACAAAGLPFVRVPRGVYAAAAPVPDAPDLADASGGHILLTSGTTGSYKKILVGPATEAAKTTVFREVFEIAADSVVSTFDLGGWTGVGYLIDAYAWDAGGCVVIDQRPDPADALRHPGITHAFVTPHLLGRILAAPPGALRRNDAMRLYVTAGSLSRGMAAEAKARLTRRILTSIGATEASTFAMTPVATDEDLTWHRVVGSRAVEIVDDADRPVPVGQVGRLRVGTFGGVTGYLQDEEASREFFRDGFFYTGDLAVFRSDGRFALQGRVTDVINVRGDKVAAGPIEESLRQRLGVGSVCVFSMQHEDGSEMIHVAIEARAPIEPSRLAAALDGTVLATLRTRFHLVEALPRNHMGKVQRALLREHLGLAAEARRADAGLRDPAIVSRPGRRSS